MGSTLTEPGVPAGGTRGRDRPLSGASAFRPHLAEAARARAILPSASEGAPQQTVLSSRETVPPTLPGSPGPPVSSLWPPQSTPQSVYPGPRSFPGLPSTSGGPRGSAHTHVCILRRILCSHCEARVPCVVLARNKGSPYSLLCGGPGRSAPTPGSASTLHPHQSGQRLLLALFL